MINNSYDGDFQNNGYAQNSGNYQSNGYAQNSGSYQSNGYAQNSGSYQSDGYAQNSGSYQSDGYAQNSGSYQSNGYAQNSGSYQSNGYAQNSGSYQSSGYAQNSGSFQNDGYQHNNPTEQRKNIFVEKQKGNDEDKELLYKRGKMFIIASAVVKLVFQTIEVFPECRGFSSVGAAVFCLLIFAGVPMGMTLGGWREFVLGSEILKKKRENCPKVIEALLVDYKVVAHTDEDGTTYTYYAIYDFTYDGQRYYITSKDSFCGTRLKMVNCKLMINPKNPNEIYEIENEYARIKSSRTLGLILMLIGASLFGLFKF